MNCRYLDTGIQPEEFAQEIESKIEHSLTEQYGNRLSFAIRLQKEALITRARAFAQRQLEDVQLHGPVRILETEASFKMELSGIQISGQIDRVDQRDDRLELIDYKTADSSKSPEKAHLAVVAKKDPPAHLPEAAFFGHEGKTYRWTDLQLPLYLLSRKQEQAERPSVAYFNLAKTLDKSSIERWDDFTESHLDSALACAEAIIDQIRKGIFWPPNNEIRESYDDFAAYFPDGIEKSVNKGAFEQYRFQAAELSD